MADNEPSPAERVTGSTVRMDHLTGQSKARYRSGRKYRLVIKRKKPASVEAQKAQAATLKDAAQQGAPFCQKCEDAKAAQTKPAAPEPESFSVAPQAAQAQAATLGGAAKSGAAFCAKC